MGITTDFRRFIVGAVTGLSDQQLCRWGVCPALELRLRTADLTWRSCPDELLRGSAEQRCAVEYTKSKTPARCRGEWR